MSLRDRIFQADDSAREQVEIPEWGVTVEVRSMSGAARARIMQDAAAADGNIDFTKVVPEIVLGCTHDPDTGERVFDEADRDAIMQKSGAALDRIVTAGMRLSGFTADAVDAAGKDS